MRQIVYLLLTCALLVDLVQLIGLFGDADFRLWQVIIVLTFAVILLGGRLVIHRWYLIIFGLVFIHSVVASAIIGSLVYSAIVQIVLLFAVILTLRSAIEILSGRDFINLFLVAAAIVALSLIAEFMMAALLPALANDTIYQVLRHYYGPLGFIRAHGLMMEPSEVSLILPPAIYVALLQHRWKFTALLIVSAILSFSALTFIGLIAAFVCFVWTVRGFRPMRVAAVLVVMGGISFLVEPVRDRIQWAIIAPQYVTGTDVSAWELQRELSGTVGSLVIAFRVMAVDLRDTWFWGAGFGNFGYGAEQVIGVFSDRAVRVMSENTSLFLKAGTGGGLAIRIVGELGIFGIATLAFVVMTLARMMRLTRKLYRQHASARFDWRIQAIGMMTVMTVPYFIRKDGYIDIYLLFATTLGFFAANELARLPRREVRSDSVRAPVTISGLNGPRQSLERN